VRDALAAFLGVALVSEAAARTVMAAGFKRSERLFFLAVLLGCVAAAFFRLMPQTAQEIVAPETVLAGLAYGPVREIVQNRSNQRNGRK
jgi:hypothetical protein